MMARSSFLSERWIRALEWSTSFSRFQPSGVNSNNHDTTRMTGKPMANIVIANLTSEFARPKIGNSVSMIWISNQDTAR